MLLVRWVFFFFFIVLSLEPPDWVDGGNGSLVLFNKYYDVVTSVHKLNLNEDLFWQQ